MHIPPMHTYINLALLCTNRVSTLAIRPSAACPHAVGASHQRLKALVVVYSRTLLLLFPLKKFVLGVSFSLPPTTLKSLFLPHIQILCMNFGTKLLLVCKPQHTHTHTHALMQIFVRLELFVIIMVF